MWQPVLNENTVYVAFEYKIESKMCGGWFCFVLKLKCIKKLMNILGRFATSMEVMLFQIL